MIIFILNRNKRKKYYIFILPFLSISGKLGSPVNRKNWPKILPEEIKSVIHSLVYYKWYENIKNIDLIDMVIDVLTRLAQTQFLPNGNKRMSILTATTFLSATNIYLYKSYNLTDNYIKNEKN